MKLHGCVDNMKYYVLASGSSGNCNVIRSGETTIVIDAGISKRYADNCFKEIGIEMKDVNGVLITHSHSDHVKNVRMFENNKVYSPFGIVGIKNWQLVEPLKMFTINNLTILPIPLSHDTDITVGYIIFDGEETLVQITDTGYVSDKNLKLIEDATYYIFESNHDPVMLMETRRPEFTKKRIASDSGHLCNQDSADALCRVIGANTKQICLAHISKEANTRELAFQTLVKNMSENGIDYSNITIHALDQFEIYQGGSN